ncbi:hypothetical protein Ddc_20039 [Ditylenchus destructor]|nr:hypothetical protein Ddc_20039 [Ditylenchus destructor]
MRRQPASLGGARGGRAGAGTGRSGRALLRPQLAAGRSRADAQPARTAGAQAVHERGGWAQGQGVVERRRQAIADAARHRRAAREGRLQVLGLSGNGRVAVLGEKCTPEFLVDLSNGTTRAVQLPGLTPPAGLDPNLRLGALAGCTIHALSPDAKLMAIKYRYEGKIAVVDALKGDVIASIALENPIDPTASSRMPAAIKTLSTDRESRTAGGTALSFSPDGRQLRVLRVIRWPLSEGLLELRSSVSLKLESSHALPPLGMGAQYVGAMLDLGPPGRPVLAMPRKSPQGYDLVAARGFGPGASGSGTAPAELWPLDAATTASSLALTEGELFIQRSRLKPYDMRRAADPKLSFAEGLAYSNAFSVAPYEWQIERWSFRSSSLDRQQTFSSALPATPGTLAYSADGKWAAALSSKMANLPTTPGQTVRARSESTVALIDLESSRTRWSKVFNQYADFNGPTAVAVSPDGSVVAVLTPTADRKNQLLLLNGQSGAVISQTDVESKGGASNTTLHFTQGGAGLLVAGFYEWTHYSLDKAGKLTRLHAQPEIAAAARPWRRFGECQGDPGGGRLDRPHRPPLRHPRRGAQAARRAQGFRFPDRAARVHQLWRQARDRRCQRRRVAGRHRDIAHRRAHLRLPLRELGGGRRGRPLRYQ